MAEKQAPAPTNIPLDQFQTFKPLDGLFTAAPSDTPSRKLNRVLASTALTGEDAGEASQRYEMDPTAATREAQALSAPIPVETMILDAQNSGVPPEQAVNGIISQQTKQNEVTDLVMEGVLTAGDPRYNPVFARAEANRAYLMELLQDAVEEENKSTGGYVLDWVDRYVFRQFPIGSFEDLTNRSNREGSKIAVAAATKSPEEFKAYAAQYVSDLRQEGVFRSSNVFALSEGMDKAENNGYDPIAGVMQIMAPLDLIPMTAGALRLTKRAFKLHGPASSVSAIKGVDEATKAAENLATGGVRGVSVAEDEALPGTLTLSREPGEIAIHSQKVSNTVRGNKIIDEMERLRRDGVFGKLATPEQVAVEAAKVKARLIKGFDGPVINEAVVVDTLGDHILQVNVGKTMKGDAGGVFKFQRNADSLAEKFNKNGVPARVTLVDPDDASKGYTVTLTARMDLSRVADPLDLAKVSENLVLRALGSSRSVDGGNITTMANMGEAAFQAVVDAVNPILKPLRDLDANTKFTMDRIFVELRDGADASKRVHYNRTDFDRKFQQYHPDGRRATDADWDAYLIAKDVSDASWFAQAQRIAGRLSAQGFKSVSYNGRTHIAKIATDVKPDDVVLTGPSSTSTFKRLKKNQTVWKLRDPIDGRFQYIADPDDVMIVKLDDALGYNPGGRRVNAQGRYFITSGTENGVGRAIMTAPTEKLAKEWSTELGNIFKAIKASGRQINQLDSTLDDVIRINSKWSGGQIDNAADFAAYAQKFGWKLDDIGYKARGERIQTEGLGGAGWKGETVDDYVAHTLHRYDQTLPEGGGVTTPAASPVKAILDQFNNTATQYAYREYTYKSAASWLKKFYGSDTLPQGTDVVNDFLEAGKKLDAKEGVSSEAKRKLRIMHDQITRRMNLKSDMEQAIDDTIGRAVEAMHGKKFADRIAPKNLTTSSATDALLTMGYYSAFGFFNVSQFMLQASHAMAIMAISPVHGLKAATMAIPFNMVLHAPKAARRLGFERLAKAIGGWTADELEEVEKYFRSSGRMNIGSDVLERGTNGGVGISSWRGEVLLPSTSRKVVTQAKNIGGKGLETSTMFFTAGELASRRTAMLTAISEFKKMRPGVKLNSQEARKWITRREQDLTFNMTSSSRGAWQTGLARIPTQWFSYTFRSMEAVMFGGGLGKFERARLAAHLSFVGGVSGMGAYWAADAIGDWLGLEPGSVSDTTLKFGYVDGLLSWGLSEMSDEEVRTALGTRIAPFSLFVETYRNVAEGEQTVLEALGGPSTNIVGGGLKAFYNTAANVISGNYQLSTADLERLVRTPGGVNNFFTAYGMYKYGYYEGRTGKVLPMEFTNQEAALQFVGVTTQKQAEYYQIKGGQFRDDKKVQKIQKWSENHARRANRMYEEGDEEGARQLWVEIEANIQFSGISDYDKSRVRRSLLNTADRELWNMYIKELRRDSNYTAKSIDVLANGSDEE